VAEIDESMKLNWSRLKRVVDDARDPWAICDGVLYDLCRRRPRHRDIQEIVAKVLLIGRVYAAALERGRGSAKEVAATNAGFYTRDVAPALKRSRLDAQLGDLRRVRVLKREHLVPVLRAHGDLVEVFRQLTAKKKRSLASKYLHFHLPRVFFIYDSRAVAGLRRASPRRCRDQEDLGGDDHYRRFLLSALTLTEEIHDRFGLRLTPRQLDRLLLVTDAKQ
jgi:hypothetical protein